MSDLSLPAALRRIPYFAHVADAQLALLAQHAICRTFAPGESIFLEGDPSAGLWIVEDGRVKAYKLSSDGHEYILRFFGPGDTFNDLAAFDDAPNPAGAMAVTAVTAWVIPAAAFTAALQADHALALAVLRGVVGRARALVDRVEDLALRPVTSRLARFLLEQVNDPTLAHPAVTRALIANHLATTPESISRSLRVLEKAGAIRFDRHNIVINDLDLLRDMAQS